MEVLPKEPQSEATCSNHTVRMYKMDLPTVSPGNRRGTEDYRMIEERREKNNQPKFPNLNF